MDNTVEKSFYLTSLFSDIKTKHNWTTNETKLIMLLVSELSKYKMYLPDFDNLENNDDFNELLSKVPLEYKFHRTTIKDVTNIQNSILAREIKKIIKGLLSKVMMMPHPIEKDDKDSLMGITLFTEMYYSNRTGYIDIVVNKKAIERLVAFAKYTKIDFANIVNIQNNYAIYTYLFFKILLDTTRSENELDIILSDFKDRLGLNNKYQKLAHFKEYVLDVIKKEINDYTDLSLDYTLIKEGRAFSRIKFTFNYKNQDKKNTLKFSTENLINFDCKNIKSPFEQIFKSWGIGKNKIKEIEDQYSLNAISNAIQVTQEAIGQDNIKKSPAAFFLGTLENKQLQEEVDFARAQKDLKKQQKEQERKALASEYDAIQKFVNDNDEELSKYLSAKSLGTEYPLDASLKEEVANLSCVGADKFKNFRPKLAVLEKGYFDSNTSKIVRPNMYNFLIKLAESI